MDKLTNTQPMNRFKLTESLVTRLENGEAVIGGIGNSNFDLWSTGRRPENFYMLGSMGLAAPIAFGVALAQPDRQVFALEGDGSLLMQLGCLSTIAAQAPKNLTIIVWDNGVYQITGAQPTPAAISGTDIVGIAQASGIKNSDWASDEAEFGALVDLALSVDGPRLIAARIENVPAVSQTERDPVRIRRNFMEGIAAD